MAKGEIGMKKVYIKIGYALNLICNAKVYSKANMSRCGCEKVYAMLALSESSALCPLLHYAQCRHGVITLVPNSLSGSCIQLERYIAHPLDETG